MWPRVTIDRVRVGGKRCAGDPRRDVVDHDLDRVGKPLAVRELLAIVHDVDAEADFVRHARQVKSDVSGADDVELGRRLDRFDVDVHLSTADQPGLLGEVIVELVVHELGTPAGDGLARLPERVVLVAAAADRADDPAVAEDEHLGADALRRRAAWPTRSSRARPARRARARRRRRRRPPGSLVAIIGRKGRKGRTARSGRTAAPACPAPSSRCRSHACVGSVPARNAS